MNTYVYLVEQTIAIKAGSKEEAEGLLPMYPTGFESQAYYVREETGVKLSSQEPSDEHFDEVFAALEEVGEVINEDECCSTNNTSDYWWRDCS